MPLELSFIASKVLKLVLLVLPMSVSVVDYIPEGSFRYTFTSESCLNIVSSFGTFALISLHLSFSETSQWRRKSDNNPRN